MDVHNHFSTPPTKNLDSQYYEGMADHNVSESIYIHDPDSNGIEFYRDGLPSEWRWNGGKVRMVTEPLDVKEMLTQNPYEMWEGLPPNTSVDMSIYTCRIWIGLGGFIMMYLDSSYCFLSWCLFFCCW